ncbi:MAG TPA: GNAT family N-acetyltransferase [Pedobacter sp.]
MKYEDIPLILSEEAKSFEMTVEGYRCFIDFKKRGDTIYLIHTEVPEDMEGKGVAAALVEKTFRYLEEHNLKMIPSCSYVQLFLERHSEWNKLL